MPAAIGLRVYKAAVFKRGTKEKVPVPSSELSHGREAFLSSFAQSHGEANDDAANERSWHFIEEESPLGYNSKGHIKYGTYGFESQFIDNLTRAEKFSRSRTDVEIIPLYYEIWTPSEADYSLLVFQSFQGRSCVTLVLQAMQKKFEQYNSGYALRFSKLMPAGIASTRYADAPVKKLTLIKRRVPADAIQSYSGPPNKPLDFEYAFRARRNGYLGSLHDITDSIEKNADGVIIFDGIEFDDAVADIQIGRKRMPVGVFGANGDTGAIDITSEVTFGIDGHPTYESLSAVSDGVIQTFYEKLESI